MTRSFLEWNNFTHFVIRLAEVKSKAHLKLQHLRYQSMTEMMHDELRVRVSSLLGVRDLFK